MVATGMTVSLLDQDAPGVSLLAEDQYQREVARRGDPLSREEEAALLACLERARCEPVDAGLAHLAQQARDRLVEAYQPVVLAVARQFAARRKSLGCLELLDLVNEANIGMVRLLSRTDFDFSRVYSLRGLLISTVRDYILLALRDRSHPVRLSQDSYRAVMTMRRVERELFWRLGRAPSYEEMAREMQVSPARIAELMEYAQRRAPVSLQGLHGGEDETELDEGALHCVSLFAQVVDASEHAARRRAAVRQALERLSPCQREAVWLRYGFDGEVAGLRKWEEVGQCMGTSLASASMSEGVARRKLATLLLPVVE